MINCRIKTSLKTDAAGARLAAVLDTGPADKLTGDTTPQLRVPVPGAGATGLEGRVTLVLMRLLLTFI